MLCFFVARQFSFNESYKRVSTIRRWVFLNLIWRITTNRKQRMERSVSKYRWIAVCSSCSLVSQVCSIWFSNSTFYFEVYVLQVSKNGSIACNFKLKCSTLRSRNGASFPYSNDLSEKMSGGGFPIYRVRYEMLQQVRRCTKILTLAEKSHRLLCDKFLGFMTLCSLPAEPPICFATVFRTADFSACLINFLFWCNLYQFWYFGQTTQPIDLTAGSRTFFGKWNQ